MDEFHHAAAPTYRKILDHFEPRFLLGLTATPERMDGADLRGCRFDEARLQGASFKAARLDRGEFPYAECEGASFEGARMPYAVFSHTDLSGVDFHDTDLTQAVMHKVTDAGVRWSGAIRIGMQGTDKELAAAEMWMPPRAGEPFSSTF